MNEETTDENSRRSLPFLQAATKGPGALFRSFFPFLQMAAIPILLFMLCWLIIAYLAPHGLASWLVVLSDRTMTTIFGMAWLGYLLMPEEGRRYWVPRWSRQHFIFLFYSLCVSAVVMLQGAALMHLRDGMPNLFWSYGSLITVVVNLPADLFHAAIGLTFCTLALKQRGGPIWSLRLVGWSALKIVVIVTCFSICFTIAGKFLGSIVGAVSGRADYLGLLSSLPINVANYAAYAVALGVLAFAYRHLTGWHGVRPDVLERFD